MPKARAGGAATREPYERVQTTAGELRCTKPGERLIMSRHRVALVIRESVARVTHVERPHDGVALDFREDRGGGDAGGLGVPFDDGLLRDVDFLQPLRIDQQVLRRQSKPPDCTLHSLDACPIDIDRVDLLDLDERHRPTLRLFLDLLREFFASCGVEFFRVVDSDYPRARFQDHGASGDRPGERAHSGLIHACHGMMACFPQRGLEAEHLAEALPFRPMFEAAFID
ncbi:hypothetical protein ACVIHA_002752 [Bradyrhizobium liaoningense]